MTDIICSEEMEKHVRILKTKNICIYRKARYRKTHDIVYNKINSSHTATVGLELHVTSWYTQNFEIYTVK